MSYYLRLSYNSNSWQIPSGHEYKSQNSGAHEFEYGFGFEEWFFNTRRFKGKNGESLHLGYLDPLRHFDADNMEKKDLVLYTLQRVPSGTRRFIISRIVKDQWNYISSEEYQVLKENNSALIQDMKNELLESTPVLRSDIVIKRFDQQVECQNYISQPSAEHRLWNISINDAAINLINEEVNSNSPCPDWHINTLQMFKLYDSERFDHKNCSLNI
jgi:hypothetical protein